MNDPSDASRIAPQHAVDSTTPQGDALGPTLPGIGLAGDPVTAGTPALSRYAIIRELGRGGMGVVYEARQLGLNRTVALKMILAGGHAGPDAVHRFRAEAEAVARLKHPHVVQIYDFDEADGLQFFALEYVSGGTLERRLSSGPLPVATAIQVVVQLADAIAAAHEAGIIHRDLKPANVLLTEDGMPKVTDFGLAKSLEADDGRTATGAILGTPSYMAPEQAEGRTKNIGPHTDVWALGAILYATLTGRPPFKGESTVQTLDHVRFKPPEPPRRVRADIPPGLEAVCLKCLAKNPADRYPTASALGEDLIRVRDGQQPLAAAPTRRFGRAWAAVIALLAVAAVAIALANRSRLVYPEAGGPSPVPSPIVPVAATPLTVAPADRPPGLFALLVGVREYRGPQYSVKLQYTEQDVDELARALRDRGFERRNISVLTQWNQADSPALAPTASNIRKRLKAMRDNARAGDTVIVALSGHGTQSCDPPQFYFWPAEANPNDPQSMISQAELYEAFDNCKADIKLLLVDACREFSKDDGAPIKVRGSGQQPKQPARFAAFYSCSPGQVCWETDVYRHGVFTYHLLDAFRGAADVNKDGLISLDELVKHTALGVQAAKDVVKSPKQMPYSQLPELVGDLPRNTPIGTRLLKSNPTPTPTAGVGTVGPAAPNLFGD